MRWTLVGDTGEHDPALYREFTAAHPDRVRAVLLRDVTGRTSVEQAGGVPVVSAADGRALADGLRALR